MNAANNLRKVSARKKPVTVRIAVDQTPVVKLSERDSLRSLDLLENPPAPNARLLAAAIALAAQT